jgi:hypothetical protein
MDLHGEADKARAAMKAFRITLLLSMALAAGYTLAAWSYRADLERAGMSLRSLRQETELWKGRSYQR